MSLWSRIFGSPFFIDKSLDGLGNTGGTMFFTNEEIAHINWRCLRPSNRLSWCGVVLLFTTPYVLLHSIVVIGCMHGFDWQPNNVMVNEAFGSPVLAAIGLYCI